MPLIDRKDKISVTAQPHESKDQANDRQLAEHFNNKLNDYKRKHQAIKK